MIIILNMFSSVQFSIVNLKIYMDLKHINTYIILDHSFYSILHSILYFLYKIFYCELIDIYID